MNWSSLLNTKRHGKSGAKEDPARPNYTIDADRITFSAPFRRLANKTQVHPLYDNDHLRHRMIHSAEVASVGRSLGMQVGYWLETQNEIEPGQAHKVAGIVHAACLAHDIGNPPFGHSGEESMSGWFAEKFSQNQGLFHNMPDAIKAEFTAFEGNAQGHRIVTRLEMYRGELGMDLSHAVIGAFSKYPMSASTSAAIKDEKKAEGIPDAEIKNHIYAGAKKFGFFESEQKTFAKTAQALGLIEEVGPDGKSWWRRHPLVCLVEAADDICYNIVDLEDGFTAGDLNFSEVHDLLFPLLSKKPNDQVGFEDYEKISHLRALAIGDAVWACADAFCEHYDEIMDGQYSGELIDDSRLGKEFRDIRKVAGQQLFVAPRKTKLEVRGRNVIRRVLDGVLPVFEALKACEWNEADLPEYEVKLQRAIGLDLRDVTDGYSALHAMTDYVSGMTDRYAVEVANMVSGT